MVLSYFWKVVVIVMGQKGGGSYILLEGGSHSHRIEGQTTKYLSLSLSLENIIL